MSTVEKKSGGIWPILTLMVLSPLIAEVLPGATRFSSIIVLPIEILVWGGGVLMIRYAVRKWQLGWLSMMFLALALSIAEECLIQQTSFAPMVLQIKGVTYARLFGVNYVYLLWALVYESVLVVFLPVYLVELIFPLHRDDRWLSRSGFILIGGLFILGSFFAWFSWTQIARPKVFHVPPYNPSLPAVLIALALICSFIYIAIGTPGKKIRYNTAPLKSPAAWILCTAGTFWAVLWYGLVILAFGAAPSFPPLIAVFAGLMLVLLILTILPRWVKHEDWKSKHNFALIAGIIVGSMIAGFVGFIGATPADLYFKILLNILAIISLIVFGLRIKTQTSTQTKN